MATRERSLLEPHLHIVPPAAESNDIDDASRAAAGDVDAFERLYRRHAAHVRATAAWLLGDSDVDDAVQEVFIRLWNKIHLFRGSSSFGTWFGRLTVNVVLRQRANSRRDTDRLSSNEDATDLIAARPRELEAAMDIESAVAALPARARDVFVLHDVQGLEHEEIGEMLGIAASTSRSQLARARLALRRWFTDPNSGGAA